MKSVSVNLDILYTLTRGHGMLHKTFGSCLDVNATQEQDLTSMACLEALTSGVKTSATVMALKQIAAQMVVPRRRSKW